MSQLEDMRLFVATLDTGSFTAAAERLGLSKQFISKRVMALEAGLGVRLLIRTTRHLRPTDLGRAYAEQARAILQQVDELDQAVAGEGHAPRGRLRITAPMSFGTMHLSPLLPGFLQDYPDVTIELDLSDRLVDLMGEGYDLAIRIGALADLADHACLLYGHGRHVEWHFGGAGPRSVAVSGRFLANNGELIRDAAIGGLGLAQLPTFIVGEAIAAGTLVTVLDDFRPPLSRVHAVYPQHRESSLLIHAFADYLRLRFASPTS